MRRQRNATPIQYNTIHGVKKLRENNFSLILRKLFLYENGGKKEIIDFYFQFSSIPYSLEAEVFPFSNKNELHTLLSLTFAKGQ